MHLLAIAVVMGGVCFSTLVPAPPITGNDIPGLLEGEWVITKAEMAGQAIPQTEWGTATFSSKDGKHVVEWNGQGVRCHSVYFVGADRRFFTIDFSIHKRGYNGLDLATLQCRGIIEIEGESLHLCAAVCGRKGDAVVPRTFASPTSAGVLLIHLKRLPVGK